MEIKKESKPTTSLLFDGWGSLAVAVATGALTVKYLIQYDPKYLVVNYNARSLEEAERVTEILFLTRRQVS